MAYGDKPKRQKDDMGNKGRRSGKGPKPMKGAKKARRESARQERKNLITENPVVNRSKDSGFDYTQSKRDIKKRYKKGSDTKDAVSSSNMKSAITNFLQVSGPKRYQGVTKKLGNTTAMSAMMSGAIKKGLSAGLGDALHSMTERAVEGPQMQKIPSIKRPLQKKIVPPAKFTPSKRDMELKEAHLGTPAQQSADPAKLTRTKAGGPVKPKRQKAKRKKRTIKAKF